MSGFTHFDKDGDAVMVDISGKNPTSRSATAKGHIKVSDSIMQAILNKDMKKGDVLGVARIAGLMATKSTSQLIPLCHQLSLSKATIDFEINQEENRVYCSCTAKVEGKTGVEMEALTGVSVALLTIYDMCKAIDKGMEISDIHLVEKSGGKSGDYHKK